MRFSRKRLAIQDGYCEHKYITHVFQLSTLAPPPNSLLLSQYHAVCLLFLKKYISTLLQSLLLTEVNELSPKSSLAGVQYHLIIQTLNSSCTKNDVSDDLYCRMYEILL